MAEKTGSSKEETETTLSVGSLTPTVDTQLWFCINTIKSRPKYFMVSASDTEATLCGSLWGSPGEGV